MKKSLIAAGALAALAGTTAYAQSNVQAVGLVDTWAGQSQLSGAEKSWVLGSGGMTTSWFGFKGSEDLGGGLKASFALTGFFRADTGEGGRFGSGNTVDPLFSRDANVGLSGNFGTINLGRNIAPNFLPTILFNPFGDSFTFSPLVLHKVGTNPADTGWSNQVTYTTPEFAGVKANVHYQFGEVAGSAGSNNVGANALYFGGPLALTAYYERAKHNNPGAGTAFSPTDTKKAWMFGGAYDLKAVKLFATYGQNKLDSSSVTAKTLSLGLSAPLGGGSALLSWANTQNNAFVSDQKRNTVTAGYDYNLSKRTDVYAAYMYDKVTDLNTGNSFGAGLRHRF